MNTIQTEMIFVNTLNANERFILAGSDTIYVCDSRRNGGGMTTVIYRVEGTSVRWEFTKPGMSTVYMIKD